MLTGNYDAATASFEVGYESPTQFSREYKKCSETRQKPILKNLQWFKLSSIKNSAST